MINLYNLINNIKMLENIKSLYFRRNIFLYTNEKVKLDIMKYNKNLQNLMDLNLDYYKRYSGKYIVIIINKKVEEYNASDGKLIYDGEYLNGKRNGEGIEYDFEGSIIFEGEFKNGRRWNGKVKFKDENYEIKNGNGKVKEYNNNSKLIYEGEYINRERSGKGKEYMILIK